MRLIDADALIIEFLRYPMILRHSGDFVAVNLDAIIHEVRKAPTIDPASLRPKGEWISVEDRLPGIYDKEPDWSVTVLFRTAQGHIYSGYRNIGRTQKSFYDDDWTPPYWLDESENLSFEEDEVTHWMPLPEPPNCGADMRGETRN